MEANEKVKVPSPELEALEQIRALAARAKAGDAAALPRLGALLLRHPEIWRRAGDLGKAVVRVWAEILGGSDPLATEALRLRADELRGELVGDEPTPLEALLTEQVVGHWLELGCAQVQVADAAGKTPAQAAVDLKRAESAQRRYLAAVRTLAAVRHLLPRGLLPAQPRA